MTAPNLTAEHHETEAAKLLDHGEVLDANEIARAHAHAQLAASLRLGQLHEQLYGVVHGGDGVQVTVL